MKKIKALLLIAILSLSSIGLVGCFSKESQTKDSNNNTKMKITLVLDKGGVNDQSFNQSAWEGAKKAEKEYKVEVNYIETNQESEYKTNIETAVDRGSDLIIGVGYNLADAIKEAAKNYPNQNFAIIDGNYKDGIPKNVRPILFSEEESGYLVGLISAKMSNANKFGFIGGMDIPSVTNFAVGFEKGLKEVNSKNKLSTQFANSFTDAAKGKAIATQMYNDGIEIIFTAGGGVNSGTYEAGKEFGKYVVAVDMPQNYVSPDTILTSALKNVGIGVKLTIKDLVEGKFKGGEATIFDISNGGVGYEKTKLIPDDVVKFVDKKIKK
ncbi:BMP family ABC transporter substrate-binding protein [Romboutsia maritimum]|uniref:BMP family ABC transporter substrate-binding protein n=1 Tax=Romboutsia maritimum TaxID=2020948 RepID=A0A371IWY2_9FIRM|nr:BMP family ABC transporter substrate-binding protein [Romboutsia maritimum]RDY24990.1 BMP family ABC transporter substrate-binding protein [Romboutsia maritimum]